MKNRQFVKACFLPTFLSGSIFYVLGYNKEHQTEIGKEMNMRIVEEKVKNSFTLAEIGEFQKYLYEEEKSKNTITKYIRDLKMLFSYLNGQTLNKERLLCWKEVLCKSYAPSSVNSMLAAVNKFLDWQELKEYRVKPLKIQREIFIRQERELSKKEYIKLLEAAKRTNKYRLSLLLQTICATGIRVSELRFITKEAVHTGQAVAVCKGKRRTIFLPRDLCRSLQRFCREQGIKNGVVFRTRNGIPLDRSNIWRDMKSLCVNAGVDKEKVFPHNLRHLFAKSYYQMEKDLSRLADLLGHSNISTTRIYTMESGAEHKRQIEKLGLVLSFT